MPINDHLNITLLFEAYDYFDIALWIFFSSVSAFIGTVFNSYTLIVICYFKTLHRPHYILIGCVASCSLLCSALFIPFEIAQAFVRIYHKSKLGGDLFCSIEAVGFAVCYSALMLGQMLIAINRWLAVFAPIFFLAHVTIKKVVVAFILIGMCIPLLYYIVGYYANWINLGIDMKYGDCAERDVGSLFWVRQMIIAFFPCGLALLLYLTILIRIVSSPSNERRRDLINRSRGSFPMIINVFVFVICVVVPTAYVTTGLSEHLELRMWVKFGKRTAYTVNPVSYTSCKVQYFY